MRDDIVNRDGTLSNIENKPTTVTILSGGVGGARFARGFEAISGVETCVVVNVGDDAFTHGLPISPDVDTVLYTLAGLEGPSGWGRSSDTFVTNDELARFELDNTLRLGDRDLALKIARLEAFQAGERLSSFTSRIATLLGIGSTIIPATDDELRTEIRLDDGRWLTFQEYFVTRGHRDQVAEVRYVGADTASPAPAVIDSIEAADILMIAPSNPPLSIWPILAIPAVREAVTSHPNTLAVSPLVGGKAVKGPAVEVMAALGLPEGNPGVLESYAGLIGRLVIHQSDAGEESRLKGVDLVFAETLVADPKMSRALAQLIVSL
jgi:LPPG:FO 2-phospho-L-lactate transferase